MKYQMSDDMKRLTGCVGLGCVILIPGMIAQSVRMSLGYRPVTPEQRAVEEIMKNPPVWRWADKKTGLFHDMSCPERDKEGDTIERAEALREGLKPCPKCKADVKKSEDASPTEKLLNEAIDSGALEKILKDQQQQQQETPRARQESKEFRDLEKAEKYRHAK